MTIIRVGALFAGYGGIELALAEVAAEHPDVEVVLAWYCEVDPAASKVLAHRYPGVPNHGDITKVDWATVDPVDVITGGSPCQDLSHAGKRAGMKAGTRSGLWASMCDAIEIIRPRLVIWENVRGALSAGADSAMEPCPICMGDGRGTYLRALGRVLGDLAELRYDARWYGLRVADVGGAHGRFRVFVIATPADAGSGQLPRPALDDDGLRVTGERRGGALTLLPTPTSQDAVGSRNSTAWRSNGGEGINIGDTLTDFAWKYAGLSDPRMPSTQPMQDWQQYDAAIRRAEHATGRPAPPPTETGPKGTPRLSPRFVEWLMMLPAGHVTDVPGLSRNDMLKMLGNGVVPAQCAAALRAYLHDEAVAT